MTRGFHTKVVALAFSGSLAFAAPASAMQTASSNGSAQEAESAAPADEVTNERKAEQTERLDEKKRRDLNKGLSKSGRAPVDSDVHSLKYLGDGSVQALDSNGKVTRELIAPYEGLGAGTQGNMTTQGWMHPEVKRIIGACLGFGGTGGLTFEALVQKLATPKNAAKFVIRRLGVFGAVSCAGGVIWEYA